MDTNVPAGIGQCQGRVVDQLRLRSKARLRLEHELSGMPNKALAFDLCTPEAVLSRILSDQSPDDLPSHKVPLLTRAQGPGFIEWLALQCGGAYHHGEHAPHCHKSVTILLGLLAKQSGAVVQQLLQDLEDHLTSNQDLPGLRRLKTIVEELISDVEEVAP